MSKLSFTFRPMAALKDAAGYDVLVSDLKRDNTSTPHLYCAAALLSARMTNHTAEGLAEFESAYGFTLRDEGDVVTVECDEKKSGVALLSAARLWIGKGCPMVEVECSSPDRQTLVDMILASAKVSYPEPLETGRLTARQIIHETLADLPDRRWWLSDFRERYVDSRDDAVNAALLREVNARIIHLRCQIPTDEHDSARALQARGASVARALSAEAGPAGSKSAEARPVEVKPADSKPAGISDTAPASPTLPAISPISPSPAPRAPSPLPSLSPSLW